MEDWEAPGTTLTIQLDPGASPIETAQRIYSRARKDDRGAHTAGGLLAAARARVELLEAAELNLSQLGDGREDVAAFAELQVGVPRWLGFFGGAGCAVPGLARALPSLVLPPA